MYAWAYSFGTNDTKFIFINKDGDNAKANLARVKDQIDCLPEYLRFEQILEEDETTGKLKTVKSVKNATSMKHPVTRNQIMIKPSASSYTKALTIGRGLTAALIHYDEPEFTKFIKTIVENSVSTFDTAARIARQNHSLYSRCFSCTPGDLDTDMGMESQEILAQTCRWTEAMYDMAWNSDPNRDDENEVLQYVKNNGSNMIVYIEYNYKQLGLTDEWARSMYNKIGNPVTFKREILLQRLRGSSESPFDRDDLDYIITVMQQPIDEMFLLDHFRFDIYEILDKHIPYLIGIDCSTGSNGDNNAITILNPYTVRPAAEFACPYIGETLFEKLIIELIRKVLPKGVLCIERNSVGDAVIDHLLNSPVRQNLYFDKNKDFINTNITAETTVESMLKKQAAQKHFYGVYTEQTSREHMMNILTSRMIDNKDDFVTRNITNDIVGLVRTKTGKIAAAPGLHDDSIMSYLISMYVYYHGNNLNAFGINKGEMLTKNVNKGLDNVTDYLNSIAISDEDKNVIREQAMVRQANNYEEMLRRSIANAQKESVALSDKNLVKNKVIENTSHEIIEDISENYDLSIFDSLNGFDNVSQNTYINPYSGVGTNPNDAGILGGYGPLSGIGYGGKKPW